MFQSIFSMNFFRSVKTVDKRILLLTNEDNPFGSISGVTKMDMMRTTVQRAKVRIEMMRIHFFNN